MVRAQEMSLELDPANTKIEFTVGATLHTVRGSFALNSGTIHFNPSTGAASGLVVADMTSGESGNTGRDHKMHKEVLESQRFPEATFTPTRFSGTLPAQGDCVIHIEGVLSLHGSGHPLALDVPLQVAGNTLTAHTHIVIPYIEWGLKNPSTFILHVSPQVDVNITAGGRLTP